MSGPDRKTPDDEMLARYVDGHSEVSRAYREASAVQSPAELDRRILELARAELASTTAARTVQRRGNRWRTPLAAAAVVVLSFGVLINLQRENALQPAVPVAPEVPAQRQSQAAKEIERAPEPDASADAVAERPAAEARAAVAAPPAAASVTAAPPPAPAAAPAPVLQQKAERDAEQKRRSEQESARKRFAADAPAAMMRPQAAAADGAGTPAEPAWSCQAPDVQWQRIRRLFAAQQPTQARDAYRELESTCPDLEVPEDLRDRIEDVGKSDLPE